MDEYIDLLQQLIRCQAVTSNVAGVNKAMGLLQDFLMKRGLHCTMEELDGRHILYASTQPEKNPKLLFNAHVDVVPASEEGQFDPIIKDGWIIGRGTGDCQGNAVCIVKILCEVDRSASVGAVFSADEETGGLTTRHMAQLGYVGKCLTCVMDHFDDHNICYAEKGLLSVRLTAQGKGGHGSIPWACENPIDKLLDGYCRFRATWKNPSADDQWHKTMAATMLNAGSVHNQIPDEASMTINVRIVTPEERDQVMDTLARTMDCKMEILDERPPLVMGHDAPVLRLLGEIVARHIGKEPGYTRMNGATDACWFAEVTKEPIIMLGINNTGLHGKGEKAELASIATYAEIWKEMATRL